MKVMQLANNRDIYTCNSYLLLGDGNRLDDVNTLIDPDTDGSVIKQIESLATGCDKKSVEQVIHSNNSSCLYCAEEWVIPFHHSTYFTNKGGYAPCSKT